MSDRRALLTGPTVLGTRLWKMQLNLVIPPSAIVSYTTSAEFSPVCGLEDDEFSILIESGRFCTAFALGASSPVKGHTGGTGGSGTTRSASATGHAEVISEGGREHPVANSEAVMIAANASDVVPRQRDICRSFSTRSPEV
jgi:hypothetical protein